MTTSNVDVRRELWPDVAKGLCIMLVVLWHVVTKHFQDVEWNTDLPVSGLWGRIGEVLLPLRMPLFFTLSGMFAVSALNRPISVLVRTRIAKFGYLYLVWLLIHTTVMSWTPQIDTARATSVGQLVEFLTITPTNLWYLYALALYFTVARLVRDLPPAWVLAAASILSAVAAAHLLPEPSNRGQVYQNLVFFLVGVYGRHHVDHLARRANGRLLLATLGLYAAGVAVMFGFGAQEWFGMWPLVSVVATLFGVTASVLIARNARRTTALLAHLGQRTLPIYVLHLVLLAVVDQLTRTHAVEPTAAAYAVIEPIVLTVALVAACLALEWVLRQMRLGVLFDPPFSRPLNSASSSRYGRDVR